jgi:four helix bundle protein
MKSSDLKERPFDFGVRCVKLAEALPKSRAGDALGSQLLRCGTSVGANYRAACRGRTRAEFVAKLGIVEEECDECLFWLDLIARLGLIKPASLSPLRQEADEILCIIISSIKTARANVKAHKQP